MKSFRFQIVASTVLLVSAVMAAVVLGTQLVLELGERHPGTASSYSNLAGVLGDQGKLAEAERMHRRALATRLKALGDGHPDSASSYHHLAQTPAESGPAIPR